MLAIYDRSKKGWDLALNQRNTRARERIHIPPKGKRKIIDSKVPGMGWDMLLPWRGALCCWASGLNLLIIVGSHV